MGNFPSDRSVFMILGGPLRPCWVHANQMTQDWSAEAGQARRTKLVIRGLEF